MSLRLIRGRDLIRVPWKNGGGTTVEVAVAPPGSTLDDFDWRVSMADVATEGPFSLFAGIDRTLALVEGSALDLDIEGRTHRLDDRSPFLSFPGEARTSARLPSGAIRDLNVMTRRARFTHRMSVLDPATRYGADSILVLVATMDESGVTIDGEDHRLDRFDVLIADPGPRAIATSGPMIAIALSAL